MDNEAMVFEGSRKKAIFLLLGSTAFVCIGIFLGAKGDTMGFIVAGFFGLGLPVSVFMLIPGNIRLTIDNSGFEMKTMRKPMKLSWEDVDEFYIGTIQVGLSRTKMIGIKFSDCYKQLQTGRKIAMGLTGMEGALPNHFNKPPEVICEILNRYKKQSEEGT